MCFVQAAAEECRKRQRETAKAIAEGGIDVFLCVEQMLMDSEDTTLQPAGQGSCSSSSSGSSKKLKVCERCNWRCGRGPGNRRFSHSTV